ncbi:MAG: phosphoglycolate phosphatase [Paracoccaceae bacterium]|jgi:phosphoglycolate phosphatase
MMPDIKPKAVLFDKDGTLFDFQATWGRFGVDFLTDLSAGDTGLRQRLADRVLLDLERALFHPDSPLIAGTNAEVVDLLLQELPALGAQELIEQISVASSRAVLVEAVPLRPVLFGLRAAGLKLGIATNDAEAAARAHAAAVDVETAFDFIAGFDSGFGGKPAPGMCLGFCDAVGVPPEQTLMVGDSTHDLHAGRAAGMICVGVLTGPADHAALAPYADVVLPDIGHLAAYLGLT